MDDSKMPRIRRKEDLPDVMTMPLVAKTLGCSLTVAYRLLKRDDFPHTVSGQRVYIDKGKERSLWLVGKERMAKAAFERDTPAVGKVDILPATIF